MAHTEITKNTYSSRVGNSLKGILLGLVLFIAGTILLFWNEGSFVDKQKVLNEGQRELVHITDINTIDPKYNGKLVYVTGLVETKDSLKDELFGVKEHAIALERKVEYYQWVEKANSEKKDKVGGSQEMKTTYTYHQEWVPEPINSTNFKDPNYRDKNFVLTKIDDKYIMSQNANLGVYKLPNFVLSAVKTDQPVTVNLNQEKLVLLENSLIKNNIKKSSNSLNSFIHIVDNVLYVGGSSVSPALGDVRVTYTKSIPSVVSLIAKSNANTFEHYYTSNGENISKVVLGSISAENMFRNAHNSNTSITWLIRIGGMVMVILGLKAMFGIVETLFKLIPMLSNMIGAGVGLVVTLVGIIWTLLIVSIAWVFYRPIIAVILLSIIVGIVILLKSRTKSKDIDLVTANI